MTDFHHITVLLDETVQAIVTNLRQGQDNGTPCVIVDCTSGGGGHLAELVRRVQESGLSAARKFVIIGIDRDPLAIAAASARINQVLTQDSQVEVRFWRSNFSHIADFSREFPDLPRPEAIYADLGVSSPQFDTAERGFSFQSAGPLDMRMDPNDDVTARDLLETADEKELARIFFEYGEEPRSRRLAQAICQDRKKGALPLESTVDFANYVARVLNYHGSRTHPATKVFQALRIAVNGELAAVESLLEAAPALLAPKGTLAVISFHSLEDRLVKRAFRSWERPDRDEPVWVLAPAQPGLGREIPRGGTAPSEDEVRQNSRARSARLRVFCFDRPDAG